jgi:hypothetical protein
MGAASSSPYPSRASGVPYTNKGKCYGQQAGGQDIALLEQRFANNGTAPLVACEMLVSEKKQKQEVQAFLDNAVSFSSLKESHREKSHLVICQQDE